MDDSERYVGIVYLVAPRDRLLGPCDREPALKAVVYAEVAMEMGEQACRPPIGREAVEPAGLAEHADERRGAALTFPVAQRVAQRPHGMGGVARARVRDGREQEPVHVVRGDIERAADPSQGVFRRVLVERDLAQGQQRPRCARVPLERARSERPSAHGVALEERELLVVDRQPRRREEVTQVVPIGGGGAGVVAAHVTQESLNAGPRKGPEPRADLDQVPAGEDRAGDQHEQHEPPLAPWR